jgi:hypothetical protein
MKYSGSMFINLIKKGSKMKSQVIENFGNSSFSTSMMNTEFRFDTCKSSDDRVDMVKAMKAFLETIDKLGWVEHTSDWDPYLIIKLGDGTVLKTLSGYFLITQLPENTDHILIEAPDLDDLEDEYLSMPIEKYRIDNVYQIEVAKLHTVKITE